MTEEEEKDFEDFATRTTDGQHSPDCECSICEYEEGFEIGIG